MQPSRRSMWQRAALALVALAALWHARRYDFFCDDAYIALRYAKNLIEHHELAYNLGQRVEGFTSPLWVLLIAALGALGLALPEATRLLAAGAVLLTFWALCRFWDELEPETPRLVLAPAAALAVSAPFAAWTFGGLETPLFVALFTLTLSSIARAARQPDLRRSFQAGLSAALCVLCRPEGATLLVMGSVVICLPSRTWPEPALRRLLAWLCPILVLVGGYQLFRLLYYGFPLPNTFYVKTSGAGLWQRGVIYLEFAGNELGWHILGQCAIALVYLVLFEPFSKGTGQKARSRRVLLLCTGVAALVHLSYVARVGGDFLDLYRFLTPLLPAAFCVLVSAGIALYSFVQGGIRIALLLAGVTLFALNGQRQWAMALHANRVADSSRAALRLEPLGWTRVYAKRWQGIGTWLQRASRPGDSTAVGAAGALPYYSELPNLDLFGLNDLEVARHGRIIGNRPGHQRFATMDYLFAQKPTFVFMNPEATPLSPGRLRHDRYWESHGYVPIEIRVDRELCGCAETFYHQFFVRRERAESLRGRADVVLGDPRG